MMSLVFCAGLIMGWGTMLLLLSPLWLTDDNPTIPEEDDHDDEQ